MLIEKIIESQDLKKLTAVKKKKSGKFSISNFEDGGNDAEIDSSNFNETSNVETVSVPFLNTLQAISALSNDESRKKEFFKKSNEILNILFDFQLDLMDELNSNSLDVQVLKKLVSEISKIQVNDKKIYRILSEIKTRASVEIAKYDLL